MCQLVSRRLKGLLALLESSLLLIVVVQVTILALSLGVDQPVGMLAIGGVAIPSVLVVTMIAHSL